MSKEKKYVISRENLPTKLPLFATLVTALACDYWDAPGWLWGALGVLFLALWIYAIIRLMNDDDMDVIDEIKKLGKN